MAVPVVAATNRRVMNWGFEVGLALPQMFGMDR